MTFDSNTGESSFTSTDTQTYNQPSYQIFVSAKVGNVETLIQTVTMSLTNPCENEHLQFALPEVFD